MPTPARNLLRTLMLAVVLVAAPAFAADSKTAANDQITLNFHDTDINAIISTISQITGRNFIVDPRVKGKVTLVSGQKLSVDQVYDVFLSVLEVHNFAAVEGENGMVKIVPSSLVKQSATVTSFGAPRPQGDEYITEIYQLKHAAVQDLVAVLRPLLPPTDHFSAHAQSNTLVFTGTAANVRRIIKVVQRLDQPPTQRDIHVVYLRYARAADLVKVLTNLLSGKSGGNGKSTAGTEHISVQADESTNSLVIQASEGDFIFIRDVIDRLDIRRAQVFMEVIIAEVSADKAQQLGVRWNFGDNNLKTGQTTGSTDFPDISGGLTVGYLKGLVENLDGTVVPDLQVVLSALKTDSNSNILSTPTLLTLDNEKAEILVGQEVPFITGQFTTTASTTTTTTTTNTGTGGDQTTTTPVTNPFQTIERKDVGVKLKITPQINEGNAIRLNIEQEVSNVSPTKVEGASDLITNQRTIKTTVIVDDGQIIVLGGLMFDDFGDTIESVPVLGDIPVLGTLFRKKGKTAFKRNLMFFLRPRIVRSRADLDTFTGNKYRYIREQQQHSLPDTEYYLREMGKPVLPHLDTEPAPATPATPAPAKEGGS